MAEALGRREVDTGPLQDRHYRRHLSIHVWNGASKVRYLRSMEPPRALPAAGAPLQLPSSAAVTTGHGHVTFFEKES